MLESSAPLSSGDIILLLCGTVNADAKVVWKDANRIGARFDAELAEIQVREQILRSQALALRLSKRSSNAAN